MSKSGVRRGGGRIRDIREDSGSRIKMKEGLSDLWMGNKRQKEKERKRG
jgi:hypothetical protein